MALYRYDPWLTSPFGTRYWDPFRMVDEIFDSFFDDRMQLRMWDNAAMMKFDDKGSFNYRVNVSGYKPEELKVDIEGDDIVVQGEHKEQREVEYVQRQFLRRVRIPQDIEKETIHCDLDDRGHLAITGKKAHLEETQKRSIPIGMRKSEQHAVTHDQIHVHGQATTQK